LEKALTRKQIEAIPYLTMAKSIEAGCRKAKISKTTFYSWIQNTNFENELNRTRETVIREAIERLKGAITGAVDGLVELAGDKEKNVKLRACIELLHFHLRLREGQELESRLEKIERIIFERRSYK